MWIVICILVVGIKQGTEKTEVKLGKNGQKTSLTGCTYYTVKPWDPMWDCDLHWLWAPAPGTRSIGPGLEHSIAFTGFIQCCNVTNSVVPFSLPKGSFVGATSLVLQLTNFTKFYIRSLAVARFD